MDSYKDSSVMALTISRLKDLTERYGGKLPSQKPRKGELIKFLENLLLGKTLTFSDVT